MSPMRILSAEKCGVLLTFALIAGFALYGALELRGMILAVLQRFPTVTQ